MTPKNITTKSEIIISVFHFSQVFSQASLIDILEEGKGVSILFSSNDFLEKNPVGLKKSRRNVYLDYCRKY